MAFAKKHLVWVAVLLAVLFVPVSVRSLVDGYYLFGGLFTAGMLAVVVGLALWAMKTKKGSAEPTANDPLLPKEEGEEDEKKEEGEDEVVATVDPATGEATSVN